MNKIIDTVKWRTANGEIPLCDQSRIDDVYLQNILAYCEQRYMKFNNDAVFLSIEADKLERQSQKAYDSSVIFYKLIADVREEGKRRGLEMRSLADKDKEKYHIIRALNAQISA
jgi:hypothetical protein